MKKIVRLKENELRRMISESVKRTLNEMGTPKQNAFLRRLMGNRYKSEYDNLPVDKSSEMIDAELNRSKNNGNASEKQISFIEKNKYFSIPSIRSVADKLTKEDANALVSALNPYTNGIYTYYGHARQRKEEWLPQMKETVVPILEKYGLTQEAVRVTTEVDNFMAKFQKKIDRKAEKAKQERMQRILNGENTLFFISTKDDENMKQHQTERLSYEIYMDGVLEEKIGWDIAELATDITKYSIDKIKEYVIRYGRTSFPTIVLGYDNICYTYLWMGIDIMGRQTLCGIIVDEVDNGKAYEYAKRNEYKQANGERLSENKLRKIVANSIKKVLRESVINEEYYPEDDDMMDDYYYGAMITFSIEGMFDDMSEETVQKLVNTNEEYCETSNGYCSVMVTKVNVQPDEFGDYEITVEAAVSAPEMPIDAIEEDAQDQIWYWFDDKTGQRAINVKIIDEKEVFDNRTEKYK